MSRPSAASDTRLGPPGDAPRGPQRREVTDAVRSRGRPPHWSLSAPFGRGRPAGRRGGRQALAAAATQPAPSAGRNRGSSPGSHSPGPAQHEGVLDHDHGAQLRTLGVVVLTAVFTPCKQTPESGRDTRQPPLGPKPRRLGLPADGGLTLPPTWMNQSEHRPSSPREGPALWSVSVGGESSRGTTTDENSPVSPVHGNSDAS